MAILLFAVILAGWSIPGARKAILHNAHTNPGMQESPVPAPEPELIGLAAAVTVAFLGVSLVRALFAGLNFGVDDLTYHAPAFADWVTLHSIVLSPFDYHAYYSFNAEALAAWCVLPLHPMDWFAWRVLSGSDYCGLHPSDSSRCWRKPHSGTRCSIHCDRRSGRCYHGCPGVFTRHRGDRHDFLRNHIPGS